MKQFDSKKRAESDSDKGYLLSSMGTSQAISEKVVEIPISSARKPEGEMDTRFLDAQNSVSFENNQLKALKTKLLYPASGKLRRTIAVTSPGIGDGKTYIATHLALNMAQNVDEKEILLVDCDVRMPSINKIFGFGNLPGLSEYLQGNIPLSSVLFKTKSDRLTILPAARNSDNPSELLSSAKMLETLSVIQTQNEDRFNILDLPSPSLVPEAGIIVSHIDGVLIVVRYGQTTKNQLQELIDVIGKENVVGVVFNHFDTTMHSSVYRMYRKYVRRR